MYKNGTNIEIRKTGYKILIVIVFVLSVFIGSGVLGIHVAQSAVPQFINYQSRLRDSASSAITSATTIQFSIYNHSTNGAPSDTASSAGSLLWTGTTTLVVCFCP